jgi:hypothetical protein
MQHVRAVWRGFVPAGVHPLNEEQLSMRRVVEAVIVAMVIAMIGLGYPGIASAADTCPHGFGSRQQLADGAGVQEWQVTGLKKSADPAPGYQLAGQLWEATASVTAVSGTVLPIIPNFNAPTADGGSYPALWELASPQGLSAAALSPGQISTGKVYFDVTGADPVAVTYTNGGPQQLMWCCDGSMMAMPMTNGSCCPHDQPCPCCDK